MLRPLVILAALAGTARAETPAEPWIEVAIDHARASSPAIEAFSMEMIDRARRLIAVGPTVGVWSAAFLDPGNVDAALSIGLGLEVFHVPRVFTLDQIHDLVVERVRRELRGAMHETLGDDARKAIAFRALVARIYADVRAEVMEARNPHHIERPAFSLAVEANRLFGAERWLGRVRAGVGVWRLTLGASVAAGRVCRGEMCDDGVKLFAGPEAVLHVLTSSGTRSPIIDGFVRFDVQATGRGMETYDQVVLGARFLIDAI